MSVVAEADLKQHVDNIKPLFEKYIAGKNNNSTRRVIVNDIEHYLRIKFKKLEIVTQQYKDFVAKHPDRVTKFLTSIHKSCNHASSTTSAILDDQVTKFILQVLKD